MAEATFTLDKIKSLITLFDNLDDKITNIQLKEIDEIYQNNKNITIGFLKKKEIHYDNLKKFFEDVYVKCDYVSSPNKEVYGNIEYIVTKYINKKKILNELKDFFNSSINISVDSVTLTSDEVSALDLLINLKNPN